MAICERLAAAAGGFLGTRATPEQADGAATSGSRGWNGTGWRGPCSCRGRSRSAGAEAGTVLVVCAGTSDLPVAEEAAVTAEALGTRVERLTDVGVAGLHRLLSGGRRAPGGGCADRGRGDGGGAAQRGGRAGPGPGDRGADQRGVRRLVRRRWPRCSPCSTPAPPASPWSTSTTGSAPRWRRCRILARRRRLPTAGGRPARRLSQVLRTVFESAEPRFVWLDLVEPTRADLERGRPALRASRDRGAGLPRSGAPAEVRAVRRHQLRDPPRLRRALPTPTADTVQALTRKVAMFWGADVPDHHPSQGAALPERGDGSSGGAGRTSGGRCGRLAPSCWRTSPTPWC